MTRVVQLSRVASLLAIEVLLLTCGCSRHNDAAIEPPDGRPKAEAAIRQALPSREITFRDEQSFTAQGHAGAVVCGVYHADRSGDDSFIWGAGDSIYPGLKTQSSIGIDPFLRAQIAYCVDLPSDADADAGAANAQGSQQGSNIGVSIL